MKIDSLNHEVFLVQFHEPQILRNIMRLRVGSRRLMTSAESIHDTLKALADMRAPQAWFPLARQKRRKWVLHVGPTNSGKTFHALRSVAAGETGAYCGPLRLLAWEVHEKLNEGKITGRPVPCELITGQERVMVPNARHRSSTIEMVDMNRDVDVAVIDEVQMIASPDRGWAWTRAVLGIPASELHLCGEKRSVELLRRLCHMCGDTLEIHDYQRMTPLEVAEKSLNSSLKNIAPGDCVVAFSRRQIHQLKKDIEALTPLRCAVPVPKP